MFPNQSDLDEGVIGPSSFPAGEGVENSEDEAQIVADQDQTGAAAMGGQMGWASSEDKVMGGMGTQDFGLDSGEFARGEIDVREQMDRTTARMDASTGRTDELASPGDEQGNVDIDDITSEAMRTNDPEDDRYRYRPTRHGHETGAYTDIGAGRSGVTRSRQEGSRS